MQKTTTARWLGLAGALLSVAIPAHAQFGGVVFDPTQSVHAISQIANEAKQYQTQLQQYQSQIQQYTQLVTTYNTMKNNLRYFNSKTIWQAAQNAVLGSVVQNLHGETSGLQSQLNGQSQNASMVWKVMNLAVSGTSSAFWTNQITGSSARLSNLAHIEAMDAASTQCLGAVSAYNASRTNSQQANAALSNSIYDGTDTTNSEVQQLNLANAAAAQQMAETKAQGQLQACLAAQSAVNSMGTRNAAAQAINDENFTVTQQQSNPTYYGNASATWTGYY